jgi:hypothetical protein
MLSPVTRRAPVLALVLFAVVASVDVARASVDAPVVPSCALSAKVAMSTTVFSAQTGGVELAYLAHAAGRLEVAELPADTLVGRARLEARGDAPSIRVSGWAPADSLPIALKSDVVVVADHVWLRGGARVRLLQSQPGSFVAEPRSPSFAKVRAPVSCGDLSLSLAEWSDPPRASVGKEYVLKAKSTPLYDAPGGKKVFALEPLGLLGESPFTVWETKGAWLRFERGGPERIDGWLRAQDVTPPKPDDGDAYGMGGLGLSGTGLGSVPAPVPMVAKRDTTVYLDADKSAPAAGVLEKGAKVRATPAAPGFTAIRVWDGGVRAPSGKSFHVRSADLVAAP